MDDFKVGGLAVSIFETFGLGNRSYLIHDGTVGVVIDPQRDTLPYLATAERLGVRITHVFETHIHNDYVSGGLALARSASAVYALAAEEEVAFSGERVGLVDRAILRTGLLKITVLATPGHTPHHQSYFIRHVEHSDGVLASGGSLLAGTVGRTDLLGSARTRELAAAQWHSARQLFASVSPKTRLLPTHGFGSFCSATTVPAAEIEDLTIGGEAHRNPAYRRGLEDFIGLLSSERLPIPTYYSHMGPLNRQGQEATSDVLVPIATLSGVNELADAGVPVVDLRPRRAFARRHRIGTLNIELGSLLPTYLGWMLPFEAPFVLIADDESDILMARSLLSRIGREDITAGGLTETVVDGTDEMTDSYPVKSFAELADSIAAVNTPTVLDVRLDNEWRSGHLAVAHHVPLPEFERFTDALSTERPIWVHCAAGFRAAIAASILSGGGYKPVLVDDLFSNAGAAGLTVEYGASGDAGTAASPLFDELIS